MNCTVSRSKPVYLGLLEEAKIFQPSTKVFGVVFNGCFPFCVCICLLFGGIFGGEGVKGYVFACHFFWGGGWRKRVDGIDCWFYMLHTKRWLIFYVWEVSQAVFRLLDKSSHAQKTYIYNSELLKPPQAISFSYCLTETTTHPRKSGEIWFALGILCI